MNYASLSFSELERLAYIGDEAARLHLAEIAEDIDEIEDEHQDELVAEYDNGERDGRREAYDAILEMIPHGAADLDQSVLAEILDDISAHCLNER